MQRITILTLLLLCLFGQIDAQDDNIGPDLQFKVSTNEVEFSERGGNQTITVTADYEWDIKTISRKWVKARKDGNKLIVSVDENKSTEPRDAKVTIKSDDKTEKITIRQKGAPATTIQPSDEVTVEKPKPDIFRISQSDASFDASGGSKTFTVTSSKYWTIYSNPDSWCHLSKKGNALSLYVDSYSKTYSRSTSFKIKSGSRTITVNISQSGVRDRLEISSNSAEFNDNGGTKTFTVTSNSDWKIYRTPDSLGNLSRSGNTLTLNASRNFSTSPRNSYFTIRSSAGTIQRVDIHQSGAPARLTISSTTAKFNGDGGTETFAINANTGWEIGTGTRSWGHLSRRGNTLTLKVDTNKTTTSRSDYFTLRYGNKEQRIDIYQDEPDLLVNDDTKDITLNYSQYGDSKQIKVHCKNGTYEIRRIPDFCRIENRTDNGFSLYCKPNKSSDDKSDYILIKANGKEIRINIKQELNWWTYRRRKNGGWVNMAIGTEGGYSLNGDSWFANGVVGLRIGNYKDIFSGEIGVEPGFINLYDDHIDAGGIKFHLPVYASFKLSVPTGKFYLKFGGAYNAIRNDSEGRYSLRAGFGTGWKHVDWDWAFIQFNDHDHYSLFDLEQAYIGMRLTFYLTR